MDLNNELEFKKNNDSLNGLRHWIGQIKKPIKFDQLKKLKANVNWAYMGYDKLSLACLKHHQ